MEGPSQGLLHPLDSVKPLVGRGLPPPPVWLWSDLIEWPSGSCTPGSSDFISGLCLEIMGKLSRELFLDILERKLQENRDFCLVCGCLSTAKYTVSPQSRQRDSAGDT